MIEPIRTRLPTGRHRHSWANGGNRRDCHQAFSWRPKLGNGEGVFEWKRGILWDNKSIGTLKCLNILAFHSSGFSRIDSKQKLDTLKNGDRVKGTIYRVLERFRVDIPVDIPPLLTKPFMRDRMSLY